MLRDANFADIPAIIRLLHEAHSRSHYAKDKTANIDETEAKRLLVTSIQRHGHTHGGGCWCQVFDDAGNIDGLIVGTLVRTYAILDRLSATDIFWVTSEHANSRAAVGLMKGFIGWAKANPLVVEIKCATTAVINDDPAKAGRILEHIGMKSYGNIYRMESTL